MKATDGGILFFSCSIRSWRRGYIKQPRDAATGRGPVAVPPVSGATLAQEGGGQGWIGVTQLMGESDTWRRVLSRFSRGLALKAET